MQPIIVIPARFNSERFPGKPLAPILGKSVLYRTWLLAKATSSIAAVYITTDDARIQEHALAFGAEVIRINEGCQNGTERVFKALLKRKLCPEIIVNLQGDAVLTPPWVIQALVDTLIQDMTIQFATPAVQMSLRCYQQRILAIQQGKRIKGTVVVFSQNGRALYFSKNIIPYIRNRPIEAMDEVPVYTHIGLYAYRYPMLQTYVALSPTPLEQIEGLEQLRALEHNLPIQVILVDYQGRTHYSVDYIEDLRQIEHIIQREGELLTEWKGLNQ